MFTERFRRRRRKIIFLALLTTAILPLLNHLLFLPTNLVLHSNDSSVPTDQLIDKRVPRDGDDDYPDTELHNNITTSLMAEQDGFNYSRPGSFGDETTRDGAPDDEAGNPTTESVNTQGDENRFIDSDHNGTVHKTAAKYLQHFDKYLIRREFVKSENGNVFIFGAVVYNSTESASWDAVHVYGQWISGLNEQFDIGCCFKDSGNKIYEMPVENFGRTWHNNKENVKLQPWHITCSLPSSKLPIDWVSIARGSRKCEDADTFYIRPFFALKKEPGHFVVCTKTAHEQLDPDLIIAQFETLRYLGIDKVIAYVENTLWEEAKIVLGYYAWLGYIELYSYELADTDHHPRKVSQQDNQIFADQTTVMRDAVERSIGSTYFSILDYDEFPIPVGHRTLKETLESLAKEHPLASSFVMKNQHFFTDVPDPAFRGHGVFFSRYLYTPPGQLNMIHKKLILNPSRVRTGSLYSHHVKPLQGFHQVICPEEEVFIRHYGSCSRKFNKKMCLHQESWVQDSTVMDWAKETVAKRIISTLKLLFKPPAA